jgi:hypothetical protein
MKVIALTILRLMLTLIAFGSALSRKKLRVEMFFDEPAYERRTAGSGRSLVSNPVP